MYPLSMAELVIKTQSGEGQTFVLPSELSFELRIGRDEQSDILLEDASVSRRHASIVREGDKYVLKDNQSTTGTTVNGRLIQDCELNDGDHLTFGPVLGSFRLGSVDHKLAVLGTPQKGIVAFAPLFIRGLILRFSKFKESIAGVSLYDLKTGCFSRTQLATFAFSKFNGYKHLINERWRVKYSTIVALFAMLAVVCLYKIQINNNRESHLKMGLLHKYGLGKMAVDEARSIQCLEMAAKMGDLRAVGELFELRTPSRDVADKTLLVALQEAAGSRDGLSMKMLGDAYQYGNWGLGKDRVKSQALYNESFKIFSNAASRGDPIASWHLSRFYSRAEDGDLLKRYQNSGKELEFVREAAAQGVAVAQYYLGGTAIEAAPDVISVEWLKKQDLQCAEWLKKAGDQSYAPALYTLAYRYLEGRGVIKDQNTACQLFLKAADLGYVDAQLKVGELYYKGDGVVQDYAKSRYWFQKASSVMPDSLRAKYWLALMVAKGLGGDQDEDKGLSALEELVARVGGEDYLDAKENIKEIKQNKLIKNNKILDSKKPTENTHAIDDPSSAHLAWKGVKVAKMMLLRKASLCGIESLSEIEKILEPSDFSSENLKQLNEMYDLLLDLSVVADMAKVSAKQVSEIIYKYKDGLPQVNGVARLKMVRRTVERIAEEQHFSGK
jgi:TPR repeat protein/pSer/pThr/pTyr-binding forkhead associated (FHA) protein